jgi:hypothetical protein
MLFLMTRKKKRNLDIPKDITNEETPAEWPPSGQARLDMGYFAAA